MRIVGSLIFIISFISTFLLAYGFRDFSLQLSSMFFLSVIGLPFSTYLIIRSNHIHLLLSKSKATAKPVQVFFDDDDGECEVEGRFCVDDYK